MVVVVQVVLWEWAVAESHELVLPSPLLHGESKLPYPSIGHDLLPAGWSLGRGQNQAPPTSCLVRGGRAAHLPVFCAQTCHVGRPSRGM